MTIQVRPAAARGHANHGWLESRHTFSFADYFDSRQMGFGALRVINEDRVAPGGGFPTHGHRDMEIVSYVISGALAHKDSLGGGSLIRPGDVQVMSAGTGIRHSEFNGSNLEPVHFLQIWLLPERGGLTPRYDQKTFASEETRGRLRLVASHDGRDGSLVVHQDADLFATRLGANESAAYALKSGRKAWVQMVAGEASINGEKLVAGDGAAIEDEDALTLAAAADGAEALLFDLA